MQRIIWFFWNANERRIRSGWRLLVQILATAALMIAMLVAVGPLVNHYLKPDGTPPGWLFVSLSIAQQIVVLSTVLLACFFLDRRRVTDLGLKFNRRWWIDFAGGIALGSVMIGAVFLIEYQCGWITLGQSQGSIGSLISTQATLLIAMIAVGFGEEIFSRGYQLKNLSEGARGIGFLPSFILATLVSSGVFGVLHAMNPNATLIATIGVFMAGVMFCVGRLTTGSLAAPIGMHISWNFTQGALGFQSAETRSAKDSSTSKRQSIQFGLVASLVRKQV